MKFYIRTLFFTILVGLLLIFLGYAFFSFKSLFQEGEKGYSKKRRGGSEREYAVFVDTLKKSEQIPEIKAYGEVKSWRSLEVRSPVSGKISVVSKIFRDGAAVEKGDFLFSIDDQEYRDKLTIANADLKDATADLKNAKVLLKLSKMDLDSAEEERRIRVSSYQRQKKLKDTGVISEASLEQAVLAKSAAERSLITKKNALAQAENRTFKSKVFLERKKVEHDIASRELKETKFFAPFSGNLDGVNAVNGRLVSTNEQLGTLIDPNAVEILFQLSASDYLKVLDQENKFRKLSVKISDDNKGSDIFYDGKIERVGGQVNTGNTGRQVFASISNKQSFHLKPGDFVRVKVMETKIKDVAKIPLGAIGSNNGILLIDDKNRLERMKVEVLRYQDNHVLVNKVPFGRKYVTKWSPQLDIGIKVKIIETEKANKAPVAKKNQTVKLSEEERALYIGMIEKNKWIPKDVKKQLINQLSQENVSKKVVDRLKKRMGK